MRILVVDDEDLVLEETIDVVKQACPEDEVIGTSTYVEALNEAEKQKTDVALLDIEMPGMDGLELAERLKAINSNINIIFVTAYSQYAMEAFRLYASGYLLKPITVEDVNKEFKNLRWPVEQEKPKLRIQCFGNFEVFSDGVPVQFGRIRAKEVLAYLVDLKGASASTGELCVALWEDFGNDAKHKHYLRNLIADLRKSLEKCGAGDVFISTRNQFSIDTSKVDCDYYHFLEQDPEAVKQYQGKYMQQYSWAEFSMPR